MKRRLLLCEKTCFERLRHMWSLKPVLSYSLLLDERVEWCEDRLQLLGLFLFSRCEQLAAASKRLMMHCSSNVLTLCLEEIWSFCGRKISKVRIHVHCHFGCLEGDVPQRGMNPCSEVVSGCRWWYWAQTSERHQSNSWALLFPLW